MRIAIISDIHANGLALEKVINDSHKWQVERYWLLGDLVGYGPDPVEILLWLKTNISLIDNIWVLGNHDAYLAGLLPLDEMNGFDENAKKVLEKHRAEIAENEEAEEFFQAQFVEERVQSRSKSIEGIDYLIVHGSQVNPLQRYIYPWDPGIFIRREMQEVKKRANGGSSIVQFFGHTHIQTFISGNFDTALGEWDFESVRVVPGKKYSIKKAESCHYLINPGSVGFPRDKNRDAAYAILDTSECWVVFQRIPYEVYKTARKITKKGYPENIVRRLIFALPPGNISRNWEAYFDDVVAQWKDQSDV